MKMKSNSLIVKMIQNSFWFIEKNLVPKPTTSCGLFLAGVVSGLWHVAYTLFSLCFLTGGIMALVSLLGMKCDLSLLPETIQIIIITGYVFTIFAIFILLPAYLISRLIVTLCNNDRVPNPKPFLIKAYVSIKNSDMLKKLGTLCKSIDYK